MTFLLLRAAGGYTSSIKTSDDVPDLRKVALRPDFWYPLARSRDLGKGKMLAKSFAGEPIVLVRTQGGEVHALENRCAHRQVPLHKGVVRENLVQCGYHGWTYDKTGRCVEVPYLSKDRAALNCVRRYPCREAYGLIFVFPGNPAKATDESFPLVPSWSDRRYKTRYLDRTIACHYSFMHENLMDMNHQFLHRSLMGMIRTVLIDFKQGDDWVEARYTFSRAGGKGSWGERFITGRGDSAPLPKGDQDTMTIRSQYPYQTLTFRAAGDKEPALDLWLSYVPTDREQRANHSYGLMMIRKPGIPGLIHLFWPAIVLFTNGIFAQDREIVELEQQAHDAQGADWNREVFPVIRALRDMLRRQGLPAAPGAVLSRPS